MREILVVTSRTSARTDCRGGGGEAGQPLGTGVFGQLSLAGNRVAALHWQPAFLWWEIISLGSLSTRVFSETQTATGRENFACQDSSVSQIFILIISNGEKLHSNVFWVV